MIWIASGCVMRGVCTSPLAFVRCWRLKLADCPDPSSRPSPYLKISWTGIEQISGMIGTVDRYLDNCSLPHRISISNTTAVEVNTRSPENNRDRMLVVDTAHLQIEGQPAASVAASYVNDMARWTIAEGDQLGCLRNWRPWLLMLRSILNEYFGIQSWLRSWVIWTRSVRTLVDPPPPNSRNLLHKSLPVSDSLKGLNSDDYFDESMIIHRYRWRLSGSYRTICIVPQPWGSGMSPKHLGGLSNV